MIKIQLDLVGSTLDDIRKFMEMTKHLDGAHEPFQEDYSIDHPAALVAEIE